MKNGLSRSRSSLIIFAKETQDIIKDYAFLKAIISENQTLIPRKLSTKTHTQNFENDVIPTH